jgi:plasmid stabilization system protein ParE
VPRLAYLAAARRDIAEIAARIEHESASRAAETFVEKLTGYCERLAELPGLLGRARPEFGRDYQSITFGSYVRGAQGMNSRYEKKAFEPEEGCVTERSNRIGKGYRLRSRTFLVQYSTASDGIV